MMSWMKSQAGSSSAHAGSVDRKKVEPGATYSLFENHWTQALRVMQTCEDAEGAFTVISHLSQMIAFLVMTRGEQVTPEKSCKSFWIHHRCSDQVIRWLHNLHVHGIQLPEQDELKLIAMLHSLCEAASRDGELLGYTRDTSTTGVDGDHWDGTYALASLLLEYSLRNTVELADTARYSFIQLIHLASKLPGLERSLSQESGLGLTNVVVSGLSACFAQLPTFTKASQSQLGPFVEQLKFVNEVTFAAPELVAKIIADCFTNAFLLAIIEPTLTQSLNEEIGIVTSYLEVICRNITHPYLIKSLIQFVNSKLLNILIHRLNTNESVSVTISTLSLFIALLEFYCEDLWSELLLKYLIPQHHLMVSQRHHPLPLIDFYDSATRLLSIIPPSISDVLEPEAIEASFLQYIIQASAQWSFFDSNVRAAISITRTTEAESVQLSSGGNRTNPNPIFPLWKHSYNGVGEQSNGTSSQDDLQMSHELRQNEISESNYEPLHDCDREEVDSGVTDPLNSSKTPSANFTTIKLENGTVDSDDIQISVPIMLHREHAPPKLERLSILTNQSDGYASMESVESPIIQEVNTAEGTTVASFGPFLDSLLVQLSNWPHLDLNVILVLTQVVSLLAGCRIPLITSLLLDANVTLQPYYFTFHTLLKRIREDLEYQLKDVPHDLIRNVWDTTCKLQQDSRHSGSSGGALTLSLSPSFGDHFGDTLRRTIAGGGAEAIANVWRRFNKKSVPSTSPKVQVHPSSGTLLKSGSGNQRAEDVRADVQYEISKTMALRLIYFTHWLLELAAIAQQQCWSPAYD